MMSLILMLLLDAIGRSKILHSFYKQRKSFTSLVLLHKN